MGEFGFHTELWEGGEAAGVEGRNEGRVEGKSFWERGLDHLRLRWNFFREFTNPVVHDMAWAALLERGEEGDRACLGESLLPRTRQPWQLLPRAALLHTCGHRMVHITDLGMVCNPLLTGSGLKCDPTPAIVLSH